MLRARVLELEQALALKNTEAKRLRWWVRWRAAKQDRQEAKLEQANKRIVALEEMLANYMTMITQVPVPPSEIDAAFPAPFPVPLAGFRAGHPGLQIAPPIPLPMAVNDDVVAAAAAAGAALLGDGGGAGGGASSNQSKKEKEKERKRKQRKLKAGKAAAAAAATPAAAKWLCGRGLSADQAQRFLTEGFETVAQLLEGASTVQLRHGLGLAPHPPFLSRCYVRVLCSHSRVVF